MAVLAGRSSASDRSARRIPRMALSEAEKIVVALTDGAEEIFGLGELARAIDDESGGEDKLVDIFYDLGMFGLVWLAGSNGEERRLNHLGHRLAGKPGPAVRQQVFLEVEAFRDAFDDFVSGAISDEPSWLAFFRDRFHGQTSEDGSVMVTSARPALSADCMSQVDLSWGDPGVEVRLTVRTLQPFPEEAYDHIATAAKISKEIADWLIIKQGSGTRRQYDKDTTDVPLL